MGDISGKKIKQKMNVNMSHTNKKPRHKLLQLFTIFLLFFPFSEKFLIQRKCFFFHLTDIKVPLGIHVSPIDMQCCNCLALSPKSWGMVLKSGGRYIYVQIFIKKFLDQSSLPN